MARITRVHSVHLHRRPAQLFTHTSDALLHNALDVGASMCMLVVYCGNRQAQTDAETVAANTPQIYIECGRAARVMCIFYCVLTSKCLAIRRVPQQPVQFREVLSDKLSLCGGNISRTCRRERVRGLKRHVVNLTSSVHEMCLLVSRRTERRSLYNKEPKKDSLHPKQKG